MPNTQIAYPFDPTGRAPTNRITGERQVLTPGDWKQYHTIIPLKAPYFGASIKLRHQPSNRILEEGKDYSLTHRFHEASIKLGKPVYASITLKDPKLKGVIEFLEYQTVGGEWTKNKTEIEEILAQELSSPAITLWDEIVDLPKDFPVVDHEFDVKDLTGAKEITREIYRVYEAIMLRYSGDGQGNVDQGLISHAANKDNPHEVDKEDVGLALVHNAGFATDEEAMEGIANLVYLNPRGARLLFDKLIANTDGSIESLRIKLEELNRAIIDPTNYYPKDQINALLDEKLDRTAAAQDSQRLEGKDLTEVLALAGQSIETNFQWDALQGQETKWQALLDFVMDSGMNAAPVVFRFTGSYSEDTPQMSAVYSIWSPTEGSYRLKCLEGSPEYQMLGIVPTSTHARLYTRSIGPRGSVSVQVLYSNRPATRVSDEPIVQVVPQNYQPFYTLMKPDTVETPDWMSCNIVKGSDTSELRQQTTDLALMVEELSPVEWNRRTRPVSRDTYVQWTVDQDKVIFTRSGDTLTQHGLYSDLIPGNYQIDVTINPDQDMGGSDHGGYVGVSAIQVEIGGVSYSIDVMRTPGKEVNRHPNNRLWNISLNQRRDNQIELGSISTGFKWGDGVVDQARQYESFEPTNNGWTALGPVSIRVVKTSTKLQVWLVDGDTITQSLPNWEIEFNDPRIAGLFTDRPVRWGLITDGYTSKAVWKLMKYPHQHPAYYLVDERRYEFYNGDAWVTNQPIPQSHFYHSPVSGMYWRRLKSGKLVPVYIAAQAQVETMVPTI